MRFPQIALPLLLIGASQPGSPQNQPVAVELFTSQGCSSCPPADAFAEELAGRSDVVVVTRPVTYWDRLGWRDTLGRKENTALQQAYAQHRISEDGVFTPQMVIAGRYSVIGSDRRQAALRIDKARREAATAIAVVDGKIGIAGSGGPAEVRLVALRASVPVQIGSGENGGRTIRYSNVVIAETVIGHWNGKPSRFPVPAETTKGANRRAIIVQKGTGGPILAATYL